MISFTLLEKPTPCPSSGNCHRFEADPAGDCTLGHERDAGSNACDFVSFMVKPASTFDDVEVVAKEFKVDARTLEEIE